MQGPDWLIFAVVIGAFAIAFLARWLANAARTSTSPFLRWLEFMRSSIANEPASYEQQTAKKE